jgi:hypothetical protein
VQHPFATADAGLVLAALFGDPVFPPAGFAMIFSYGLSVFPCELAVEYAFRQMCAHSFRRFENA